VGQVELMGIFKSKPAPKRVTKGEFNGQTWRDIGITDALVRDTEAMRRKYSRDPEAQQLVDSCTGIASVIVTRNARLLARQTLRLYRIGGRAGGAEKGRMVSKAKRTAMVKRWSGKAVDLADGSREVVEITDSPALDLINNPNPYWPGNELEQANFRFKMTTGNNYQIISQEDEGEHYLWPAFPQYVQMQASKTDLVEAYFFGREQSRIVELEPSDVIHYRNGLHRNNPLMGESDIAAVLPGIDLISQVAMHDIAFALNGYRPDHLLSLNDETTPTQVNELTETLIGWWRDKRRGGVPAVLTGLKAVYPLNAPPKDLRTPEQLEMYRKDIAMALGWTTSMLDSNDSTFAGGKIAAGQYGDYIVDKLDEDANQKTAFILTLFGLDPDEYCFVYDDPISQDEAELEARQVSLVSSGLVTVNEARATLGYDESDDKNASVLMIAGMPLGQSAAADPFAGLLSGLGGSKPVSDAVGPENQGSGNAAPPAPQLDEGEGEKKASSPDSILKAAMLGESERWTDGECSCTTKDDDDFGPNPILRAIARRYLGPLRQAALEAVSEAQADALAAYGAGREPDLSANRAAAIDSMSEALQPLVELSMRQAMEQGGAVPEDAFSVIPERAIRFLDTYTPQLADDIMETTSEIARRAVQAGLESGASVQEVAAAIEGVPAYRAERIARTELSNATHEGMIEGWQEAGIDLCKWVTAPGPSAAHAMIASREPRAPGAVWVQAGETLGKETFKSDVRKPPARPNCRCGLIAIVEGAE
jgi:phage portal protein BeeE